MAQAADSARDAGGLPDLSDSHAADTHAAETSLSTSPSLGIVTAIAPDLVEVSTQGETLLCTFRGRLRRPRPHPSPSSRREEPRNRVRRGTRGTPATTPTRTSTVRSPTDTNEEPADGPLRIAPGDRVRVLRLGPDTGVVEDVLPRSTVLSRTRSEVGTQQVMLANPDHAVLVFAVHEPEPHFGMLDRYLALCEHAGVDVTICLNKVDLGVPDEVQRASELYSSLGYDVLWTSATTGAGVDCLRGRLRGRTSLLTGPSGVGKSSLVNLLLPDAAQRTREISAATGKGRHTTTGVRLLPLPEGGWLADSAGIRELALWNVPSEVLPQAFRELRPYAGECEYEDCEHGENEEGCALRATLAAGAVTPERWASFARLLEEAREKEAPAWER